MNYCGSGSIWDVLSVSMRMFGPISAMYIKIAPIKERALHAKSKLCLPVR